MNCDNTGPPAPAAIPPLVPAVPPFTISVTPTPAIAANTAPTDPQANPVATHIALTINLATAPATAPTASPTAQATASPPASPPDPAPVRKQPPQSPPRTASVAGDFSKSTSPATPTSAQSQAPPPFLRKWKKWLIAAAVIVVLVVAGVWVWYSRKPADEPNQLTLFGNVDIRQVDLGFRVNGRIESIPFEEGSRVKAGDVLAQLDLRPFNDQLAADDAQVAAAMAQLDKQRDGNRPQDIAQAQAQLEQQRAGLVKAKADFDRRSTLVATGAVSRADFDATKSQYEAAQAQVRAAEQALSLQRAGARRQDIEAAAAQRTQAMAQRDKTRTDIADASLRAPNGGVILTRAREPGAIVQGGETVLTLTIDRPMRVRAYVDEADLSRISPDMAVEITADGNAKVYHGTIGYIAPTAEFTPKTVQTRELRTDLVYRIRVIATDPDDALRQGQPVTVRVTGARPARKE